MIPSRILVWIALGPLVLSLASLLDARLIQPMLLVDSAIVLLALIDALLSWPRLVKVERTLPRVFSVGRPNPVTLELVSSARRSLAVEVVDDVFDQATTEGMPARIKLAPRGRGETKYRVTPLHRGAFRIGRHTVRYPSPFGLWTRQLQLPADTEVRVYPDVQAVRTHELLARRDKSLLGSRAVRRKGGESEFERLREYQRGDEYRSIDWRATARSKKLISREYQIEQNQNIVFALDAGRLMTAEAHGLSLFDHALNATLMLSHVASRGGDQVGLLAFSDEVVRYAAMRGGHNATAHIVRATYDLQPSLTDSNYMALFQQLSTRMKRRSLVVIFTQVADDVAKEEVVRLTNALMPRHLPLVVLLRDTELDDLAKGAAPETSRIDVAALCTRGAAAELIHAREKMLRDLKQRGVLVLHVPPSELTPALFNRYVEVKARHLL